MMGRILASGTFNGTAAALYVCCGFVPDFVKVKNTEESNEKSYEWDINQSRGTEGTEGWSVINSTRAPLTAGNGITIYRGGDLLAAASTTYLVKDPSPDKRNAGTLGEVNTWTLQTAGSRTGKFNAGVNTTYVGEGSRICIDRKWYVIQAISNDGDATDEVTLSEAAPSGVVEFLGGFADYIGGSVGNVLPAGFALAAALTGSGELCSFEAGVYF